MSRFNGKIKLIQVNFSKISIIEFHVIISFNLYIALIFDTVYPFFDWGIMEI